MRARLEIAVQDTEGARAARAGGADRVELCSALAVGGLTPSLGAIEAAVEVGLPVHVLVRPRPGGFVTTDAELAVMVRDVGAAVQAGAAGVVVGALRPAPAGRPGHDLDDAALTALVAAAGDAAVLVHRCVDVLLAQATGGARATTMAATDSEAGTGLPRRLADLGLTGMLTSGGAPTCREGLPVLARLAQECAELPGFELVAGGGVRTEDVPDLRLTGVHVIHSSARTTRHDCGPSGPGGGSPAYDATDEAVVRALAAAAASGA